jgi:hypothetical protein
MGLLHMLRMHRRMCTDQKIRNKYDGFSIGFAGLEMGKTQTIIALRPPFEALKRTVANRSTDRAPFEREFRLLKVIKASPRAPTIPSTFVMNNNMNMTEQLLNIPSLRFFI